MAEANKKIKSVEILFEDETGYGPQGKHTRRQWRAECLENLLAGKAQFLAWQESWQQDIDTSLEANFEIVLHLQDGGLLPKYCRQRACSLDFCGVVFKQGADFGDYHFLYLALFIGAQFVGNAWFESAQFGRVAWFDSAQFGGVAWFDSAQFGGDARFESAQFGGDARFNATSFAGRTDFKRAAFGQDSAFENATFKMVAHFERAKFGKIPNFLGVDIATTRLQLPDDLHFTQAADDDASINQLSFLKKVSDEHGQWEQALIFNAMHLKAARKRAWKVLFNQEDLQKDGFWFCVFTWAYEAVADFGCSFTRPLKWLILLMLASWLFAIVAANETDPCKAENSCAPIFAQLATVPKHKDSEGKETLQLTAYRAAAEYGIFRFANFADFTDKDKNVEAVAMRLFNQPIEPWWARLFGLFKGLTGTVLLFLIGLGLRNRYRVG